LYVASWYGRVHKITPEGVSSIYATGMGDLVDVAIPPVPEPSSIVLLIVGAISFFAYRQRRVA